MHRRILKPRQPVLRIQQPAASSQQPAARNYRHKSPDLAVAVRSCGWPGPVEFLSGQEAAAFSWTAPARFVDGSGPALAWVAANPTRPQRSCSWPAPDHAGRTSGGSAAVDMSATQRELSRPGRPQTATTSRPAGDQGRLPWAESPQGPIPGRPQGAVADRGHDQDIGRSQMRPRGSAWLCSAARPPDARTESRSGGWLPKRADRRFSAPGTGVVCAGVGGGRRSSRR